MKKNTGKILFKWLSMYYNINHYLEYWPKINLNQKSEKLYLDIYILFFSFTICKGWEIYFYVLDQENGKI